MAAKLTGEARISGTLGVVSGVILRHSSAQCRSYVYNYIYIYIYIYLYDLYTVGGGPHEYVGESVCF